MKPPFLNLCAIGVGCAFALQLPTTAIAKSTERVLHSFGSGTDGQMPLVNLIDVKGALYGTTEIGGSYGDGTVFSVDPKTGAETVVYSFCSQQNCADGSKPEASLIDVSGTLYGTTYYGGTAGYGAVFAVDPTTGAETVVYSFCGEQNCSDGKWPLAGPIDMKSKLYGTTSSGGTYDEGTVFALNPGTGVETVLYSFCTQQNCADGSLPVAGLLDVKGTLFGTTYGGGAGDIGRDAGTVFSIDPKTGVETVLYSFCAQLGCSDGENPGAGLIDANGTLYGTTYSGGGSFHGTVFALDHNSEEKVLYSFCRQQTCIGGEYPAASLIDVNRTLYGTTSAGGRADYYGTVFSIDPRTDAETVVYSFCSRKKCMDGGYPSASLIDVKGTLYGTTTYGGAYNGGTVFALSP